MEDFLRDSLGIVEENAVLQVASEEVCNVSFTSALASIEEEEANDDVLYPKSSSTRRHISSPQKNSKPPLTKMENGVA